MLVTVLLNGERQEIDVNGDRTIGAIKARLGVTGAVTCVVNNKIVDGDRSEVSEGDSIIFAAAASKNL